RTASVYATSTAPPPGTYSSPDSAFFFSSRRRHTRSVSAFLLNRSSDLGATAKDISNVVTDAASGVVDIFHGIDKAVADTWNNFWKDGKADGIGSNLSRK